MRIGRISRPGRESTDHTAPSREGCWQYPTGPNAGLRSGASRYAKSTIRQLAAGQITNLDGIVVELHRDRLRSRQSIQFLWPLRPTSISQRRRRSPASVATSYASWRRRRQRWPACHRLGDDER